MRNDAEGRISYGWRSVHVQCPFWKGNTTRAVVCEGLRRGESIRWCCRTTQKMTEVMDQLCCKDYEKCRIFQMLYGGYEDG